MLFWQWKASHGIHIQFSLAAPPNHWAGQCDEVEQHTVSWPDPKPGWKDGKGFYYVSNKGRVFARYFYAKANSRRGEWRERLLEGCENEEGYRTACLMDQSRGDTANMSVLLHRLIAAAFLPHQKAERLAEGATDLTVDHIDRDRENNVVDNLRWATKSEQNINRDLSDGLPGIVHHQKAAEGAVDPGCVNVHPDHDDAGVMADGTVVVRSSGVWQVKERLSRSRAGYVHFSHSGKTFRRNRFAMNCYLHAKHGPKLTKDQVVDHISGVRSDDSKDNLRVFTSDPDGPSASMMNGRNRANLNSNNKSGIRGVRRLKQSCGVWHWHVAINDNIGHTISRMFREDDNGFEKAVKQRAKWVEEFGYYNC